MALSLYKHNQYGTLSYEQVDSNWSQIESDVNGLSARLPLNNYSATTDPTVNNDVTQGYSNGSLWYNRTTDTAFVLTNASSGAANWVERDSISASDLGTAAFSDIVGTVSQSGGTPTGAVMEYGSNANGSYWKYAGGQLVCTSIVTGSDAGDVTWTFPASFSSTTDLAVNGTPRTSSTSGTIANLRSATTADVAMMTTNLSGTRITLNAYLIAIGRWYNP